MKKRKLYGSPLLGYVAFFLLVAAIITVAVLTFTAVESRFGDNHRIISVLMLAVVAVLAAVCTAASIIRQQFTVSRHVSKILDATDKIAAGDFSVRLALPHPYYRANEYDSIMENLNKMAEELSHNEMLKSDFISGVSHELKTPLAVIQNYATLLQNDSLPAEQRRESAQTLANAAKRLTDLVSNILKLNRLEHQKIT
ncbi:MAG: HAMP domain-containing histidine kinase, partial [Clostridiales bacterium]|nr:HAMP domain-containing histidine kinase [Clostridiales bacterium]